MSAAYNQTTFDKAFIRACEFLLKEGIAHSKKELSELCDIGQAAFSQILAGERGFPKHKVDDAIKTLNDRYSVRRRFLETNRGAILLEPVEIDPSEYPQLLEVKSKLSACEQEVNYLRLALKSSEDLVATQKILIERLNRGSK